MALQAAGGRTGRIGTGTAPAGVGRVSQRKAMKLKQVQTTWFAMFVPGPSEENS